MILIEGYLKMTSQYVNIDLKSYEESEDMTLCEECGKYVNLEEESCPHCASVLTKFIVTKSFNQVEPAMLPKPKKVLIGKFWNKYLRYQGRLDVSINMTDIEKIRKHINETYYIASFKENYRSQNMSLLRQKLTTLSMGRYKDDINVVMNILWDYKIPDYSHLDDQIESNWTKGNEIITKNKQEDELQNIMHNDWRLYRELIDVGVYCNLEDFQITNNKEIRKKMEKLWEIRCKEMNKKYKPL
jgi:hypothetical protein